MSEPAAEEPTPSADAAPKKAGGAKAALAVGAINLVATGFLVFRSLTASAGPVHAEPPEAPPPDVAVIAGPVVPLDPFVVNLADQGVSRYLRATFELEVRDDKALEQLDKAKKVVRDELLRYLSGLTVADTLGEQGKTAIQEAILARLTKLLGEGRVRRLFFTEFVVQ